MKAAREAWFEGQPDLDPARIVFIDEPKDRAKLRDLDLDQHGPPARAQRPR